MKILMLSNDYYPNIGGIAAHTHYLSGKISDRGHEVHVLVPTPNIPGELGSVQKQGVHIHRWGYKEYSNIALRALSITGAGLDAADVIIKKYGAFDLLHQHDVRATKYTAARLNSRLSVPLIWTNHSPKLYTLPKWEAVWLLKTMRFNPDGIISVSRELKRTVEKYWEPLLSQYIPNGTDRSIFSPFQPGGQNKYGIDSNSFVVLCPFRLSRGKGALYFAKAIGIVAGKQDLGNWQFVFVGDDSTFYTDHDYVNEVKESLSTRSDANKVLFLGHLSQKEMAEMYNLSDLVVLPSLYDAVTLSMLEAMATRKPVIASGVGGMAEVIEHGKNGWLVPPADPEALAEAIIYLYENKELRNKIEEQGYALATEHYSWDRIADETIAFYREVIRKYKS